jgi:nuclear pore complex protein Nup54
MAPSGVGFGQTGLFGGAPAASQPSLFGSAAPTTQPSLFGSTAPTSQPSLFGSAAPASQPSLFGASSSAPQQSQFGSFAPASQPSLFGAATAMSQPSLFGASAVPASSPQQSLFGAPVASQPSLFGAAPPQPSLFGSAAGPQPSSFGSGAGLQPSLFASSAPGTTTQFGASGFGGFLQQQPPQAQQQQQQQQRQHQQQQQYLQQQQPQLIQQQTLGVVMPQRLNNLVQKLDPRSSDSPFHTALYNVVTASDVDRYHRPPGMLEKLFEEAMLNNPDPVALVPVQANGFDDLLRRVELQSTRMKQHTSVLSAIETAVARTEDSISTDLDTKLALYRRSHRELARKLLKIACRVERRACSNDSDPSLTHTELEFKRRLDAIARDIAAPALFKDKLNDLVEVTDATRAQRSQLASTTYARDPKSTAAIRDLLQEQLTGISNLGEVCRRADRDIRILEDQLKLEK